MSNKSIEERIEKSKEVLKGDLNTVRAGRANAALLDRVVVDYYGSPTPLKQLSNISTPDPRTLLITPFDPKTVPDIEKAMTEGFSTASAEARTLGFGAGMGLPNMKRNATEFDIQSEVGVGTTITMSFAMT